MSLRPPCIAGVFFCLPLYFCAGLRRVTASGACIRLAHRVYDFFGYYSLSYLACSRQILRGQRAEFKGLALMDWDFSAEHECAELKRLAPAGYHSAAYQGHYPTAPIA